MAVFIITITIFLIYLLAESYYHSKLLGRIHLRISVSGTRGKTSIVRMLASVCRSNGMRVLAKTTGSEARYILPDGSEEKIKRRGVISIIEQKNLVKKAAQLGVDCIITEIMSINPENHFAETHKLIRPHLTILSNLRADHLDVVEESQKEITALHINDIYPGSNLFIPSGEINNILRVGIEKSGAKLNPVEKDAATKMGVNPDVPGSMFRNNIDLVSSVAASLSISVDTIHRGLRAAIMDIGDSAVYLLENKVKKVYFVNSFAANDPLSAMELVDKTLGSISNTEAPVYGFLSLRADRGERSRQWLDFLSHGAENRFRHLFISGLHAGILRKKIKESSIIRSNDPATIMGSIISEVEDGSVVFGLANIHGRGMQMVNYCRENGIKIALHGI
ncbi:MAG: poly-gamma-glutamate synthase PgsB [Bacteroidia bacterium]|nr:MAG: poly-gamma-glutamate synthase PgsB [Bacteroidia bacterium]